MEPNQLVLFDACMRQAEYFAGRWDGRRAYEWKTTVAIWALFVGGIYEVKKPWLPDVWWKLLAVMIALVVGYIWLWLMPVWKANNWDKAMGRYYRDQADAIMRGAKIIASLNDAQQQPRPSFWADWSMRFQMLSMVVLVAIFFIAPR